MTQGQWLRVAGWNPSAFAPTNDPSVGPPYVDPRFGVNFLHPVEQIAFGEASRVAKVMGLTLPTEAQWEWAARAGSSSPWWNGQEPCETYATENFADFSAAFWQVATITETRAGMECDDGWPVHAPVGSFAANPFGLHDMLGNVREWCRDRGYFSYAFPIRVLTGERAGQEEGIRAVRGGSFLLDPIRGRTATRQPAGEGYKWHDLGLRVARPIDR
jgi:formylglycine-generating enzyme required for sulfatase activity